MKLYDTPLAPNPRRVRWFMAEKGIEDIEIVPLNLIQGEHKTPDYLERAVALLRAESRSGPERPRRRSR